MAADCRLKKAHSHSTELEAGQFLFAAVQYFDDGAIITPARAGGGELSYQNGGN